MLQAFICAKRVATLMTGAKRGAGRPWGNAPEESDAMLFVN